MKAIGKAKGKAKEYTKDCEGLNLNCYGGCGHGCTYCYVPLNRHLMRYLGFKDRQDFYNNPFPREGIIDALRKEAPKYKGKEVFMSFTCDPYQPINEKFQLTRQAIEILHANDVGVNILTKGTVTDFDLLAKRPELSKVGVTFDGYSYKNDAIENKDFVRDRNLVLARSYRIPTWASIEPVIYPEQVLRWITDISRSVDEFKIGKWNYDKRANDIDWHKFVNAAIELLEKLDCKYIIKEDLRRYI